MTCDDTDDLVNRGVQGDVWHQHWHRTTGTRSWDELTLLVQIRTTAGTLIASSGAQGDAEGIIGIDTAATNFTADPALLDWETTDDTAGVNHYLAMATLGLGIITRARVRVGAITGPMQFAVGRAQLDRNKPPGQQLLCCVWRAAGPVFTPARTARVCGVG